MASGSIRHNLQDDGLIDGYITTVRNPDIGLIADFHNPYSSTAGTWSYGFQIRGGYYIFIGSAGKWHVYFRRNDNASLEAVQSGYSHLIRTGANQTNKLSIIANGHSGSLWINGGSVATLDLSSKLTGGYTNVVANVYTSDGKSGYSTRFSTLLIISMDALGQ